MRYSPIDKSLFIENRKKLKGLLPANALVILNSNDEMPKNADGMFGFRQNNDLFYLSGIDQEDSILVICPNAPEKKYEEMLFLKETSELIATWEGHKYTKAEAKKASGINSIYWLHEFETVTRAVFCLSDKIYLNTNEHLRAAISVQTRDARFIDDIKRQYPLHQYGRLAPLMHQLRAVKSELEIQLLQKACSITEKAFKRVLKFVKPGRMEYEIEAEITHEFVRNCSSHAYAPIIASGKNACVLHYVDNNKPCKDGDVILFDFGAEYANYSSDLSRSIPVNGKFTPRQKAVYRAVKRVMDAAVKMLVPGMLIESYHKDVGELMEKELVDLKLLKLKDVKKQKKDAPLYKKYFMHGTSHFLGLDVHDVGNKYNPVKPGMVFTCEPGIYIQKEGLGIRLENDYLVTENGPINLMQNIPIEAEEIEAIMQRKKK